MKKGLLFAAALFTAVSMNAQLLAPKTQSAKMDVTAYKEAQVATKAERMAAKKAPSLNDDIVARYTRPAGTFWVAQSATGSCYNGPWLTAPPYRPITFFNHSSGATSYLWTVQFWDSSAGDGDGAYVDETTDTEDLYVEYGQELPDMPILKAMNGDESATFQEHTSGLNNEGKETVFTGNMLTVADPQNDYFLDEDFFDSPELLYLSPKMFSYYTREGEENSLVSYTGANVREGADYGWWFGTNAGYNDSAGNVYPLNAFGIFCEEPENPYGLRSVLVRYAFARMTGSADLKATVYKVEQKDEDGIVLGDVLGEATATITAKSGEAHSDSKVYRHGALEFPFMGIDDLGLDYYETLTIDCPILVVISGYDAENMLEFSIPINADKADEGFGSIAYLIGMEDGEIAYIDALDSFFSNPLGYVAPAIFLDVFYPMILPYYNSTETEHDFAVEGETYTLDIFSSASVSEISIMDDNNNLFESDWLTVDLTNAADAAQTNHRVATITAAALPDGVQGRKAVVRFAIPGSYLEFTATQGEVVETLFGDVNKDGFVNVTDVNLLVSAALNGTCPEGYDLNDDNTINVTDINLCVSAVLNQ